jgi:GNAT superfamily N-acetyltransferase
MWWRLSRAEFSRQSGADKKAAFKAIVEANETPGILAYAGGEPVAWCAIAPRESYPSLERSRTLKRVDAEPVWSVTCFFVARPYRRQGLMVPLLRAAVEHARVHGARIVEGYPVDLPDASLAGSEDFTGIASAFRQVGFVEVARRSPHQPIMRLRVDKESSI